MFTSILYVVLGYIFWYLVSRLSLVAAAIYSRPGSFTARHFILTVVGLMPFCFELVASVLVIFSVAFGLQPLHPRHKET